jgi:MipA family protein
MSAPARPDIRLFERFGQDARVCDLCHLEFGCPTRAPKHKDKKMHPLSLRLANTTAPAIGLALVMLCHAGLAQADTLRFSLGVMAGASQSPFDTKKTDSAVMPDFLIEGEQFRFDPSGLTVDVVKSGDMTLAARLAPRWIEADPADVPRLKGLKRKTAVEAGFAASLRFGGVEAAIEALKDISDTHNGAAVGFSVSTGMAVTDQLSIGAKAGALWMDEKLATYSYGIRAAEATGALPAHSIKASIIPSIGLQATYAVTEHVSLVSGVQAQFLPSNITRSPIVKRSTLVSAMIGVRYAF